MENKFLNEIIELFCGYYEENEPIYGIDTEIFENKEEARQAIMEVLYRNNINY